MFYVYMVASRSRTLYVGVTSELQRRVSEHKLARYEGFTKTYRCERLVWFERYGRVETAIAREKQLKKWRREKKLSLIERENPAWLDLSDGWGLLYGSGGEAGPSARCARSG